VVGAGVSGIGREGMSYPLLRIEHMFDTVATPNVTANSGNAGNPRDDEARQARHQRDVDVALSLLVREADRRDPVGQTVGQRLQGIEAMDPDWYPLAELVDIDPDHLTPDQALSYLRIVTSHQAWLEGLANRALVSAAGLTPREHRVVGHDGRATVTIDDARREEVAAALRLAPVTAHSRIQAARVLATSLPETRMALERGRITPMHARVMAETVIQAGPEAPGDLGRQLESRVLARAMRCSVGELRYAVRTAARRLDSAGASDRIRRDRRDLDVRVTHDDTGVSTLLARLRTEHAIAVVGAVEGLACDARFRPNDDPAEVGVGERRSAALVALVLQSAAPTVVQPDEPNVVASAATKSVGASDEMGASTALPYVPEDASADPATRKGSGQGHRAPREADEQCAPDVLPAPGEPVSGAWIPRPSIGAMSAQVLLVMDVPTWLGLCDDPVAVLGAGDIPAEVARELAGDASFRRAIIDPVSGHLLDYGRRTYSIPEPLRRYVQARDQVCRFPGCRRSAQQCEIDHAQPWDDDGPTSAANTGALCQRHHQLKTHGGWTITASAADGSCTWISPLGREYQVEPPGLVDIEPQAPPD